MRGDVKRSIKVTAIFYKVTWKLSDDIGADVPLSPTELSLFKAKKFPLGQCFNI